MLTADERGLIRDQVAGDVEIARGAAEGSQKALQP